MGEAGEDLGFPAGPAVGVGLCVGGGFVDDLECKLGGGCVLDEEDGAHGAFAEDFECFEVVEVELRRGWSC